MEKRETAVPGKARLGSRLHLYSLISQIFSGTPSPYHLVSSNREHHRRLVVWYREYAILHLFMTLGLVTPSIARLVSLLLN